MNERTRNIGVEEVRTVKTVEATSQGWAQQASTWAAPTYRLPTAGRAMQCELLLQFKAAHPGRRRSRIKHSGLGCATRPKEFHPNPLHSQSVWQAGCFRMYHGASYDQHRPRGFSSFCIRDLGNTCFATRVF